MRIRRGLLFWGLFLIPVGALPLLVRAGALDPARVADAWRLWPILLVALGIALILGRGRAGLLGTSIAAVALGLVVGGALASGTGLIGNFGDCANPGRGGDQVVEQSGTFSAPAAVRFDLDCGAFDVSVVSGSDWNARAEYRGQAPEINASGSSLNLVSPSGFGLHGQDWTVRLPADQLGELSITSNATAGTIDLSTAELSRFGADFNAGDLRVNASQAAVAQVDVSMNAGRLRLTLGSGPVAGSLSANAGAMELCVPPDASLRFQVDDQITFGHNLGDRGLTRNGNTWTRGGTAGDASIDLSIDGNAASFTLDPEGGC
ncbi:MAG TPA: hypothetical protein VFI69_00830 [Candidatus Limnocylindrales bacterium]|jgi:hypothetical protein|nr:hypothetical protein [Candidatus Limnocylindrales bacterium]